VPFADGVILAADASAARMAFVIQKELAADLVCRSGSADDLAVFDPDVDGVPEESAARLRPTRIDD
jgi:hypothetical protein